MTWQRYNKNLRKSALLAEYFSFWRDQGDRSLIFYFERGKDSGVKATSVFFRLARARQSPKDPLKIIQKRCKDTTYYGNSQTFWRKKSMTCPLDPVPLILVSLMYFLLQFLVFCLPFGIAFAHPIVHPFQLAVVRCLKRQNKTMTKNIDSSDTTPPQIVRIRLLCRILAS